MCQELCDMDWVKLIQCVYLRYLLHYASFQQLEVTDEFTKNHTQKWTTLNRVRCQKVPGKRKKKKYKDLGDVKFSNRLVMSNTSYTSKTQITVPLPKHHQLSQRQGHQHLWNIWSGFPLKAKVNVGKHLNWNELTHFHRTDRFLRWQRPGSKI